MSSRQADGTRPPPPTAKRGPRHEIPQHVAGLARAVNDYVEAARFGSDDVEVCHLALDGAVAAYYEIERLGDGGDS